MKQLVIGAIIACACGCGGGSGLDMATVSGVVTLDGQPLEGAIVTFVPQDATTPNSGSMSIGITDAQGMYQLGYSATQDGAVIGTHRVKISTQRQADEDEDGNRIPGVPEKVPATYNIKSAENPDMLKEVQAGKNMIDFDLKGDGKIIQLPKSEEG